MGISNLVNATQGDSARSQSRLARTGRQRTFVLRQQSDDDNLRLIKDESNKISTKDDEPTPSTSKQDLTTDEKQTRPALRPRNLSRLDRMNNDESINRYDQRSSNFEAQYDQQSLTNKSKYNSQFDEDSQSFDYKSPNYDGSSLNQFSSNIRMKLKSRFKKIPIDENLIKKNDEQKEFNKIKNKVNNRLDKTYSWKNKLISIVTGRDKENDNLITYQNEYDFFTKPSNTKQPNKLENLMTNQIRNYLEGNYNLYYPSLRKANILLAYPNLNDQLKNFIKQNKLPLEDKFTQRILIEMNENLDQEHLKLIMKNNKNDFFELSTNLEDLDEEYLNLQNEDQMNSSNINQPKLSIASDSEQVTNQIDTNIQSIEDEFMIQSINLRFFRHKHSTKIMNLSSEIISNLEFIDELRSNDCINKLTIKINKLKEVVDLIENCVKEYEMKTVATNQTDEMKRNEIVQKSSVNLIRNYLSFLNFLYLDRDRLVFKLRTTLFNLLKDWKEINSLRQQTNDQSVFIDLTFEEQNQFDHNEQAELNSLIEERLEFEKKFAQFIKPNTQLNQRLRTMFNRFMKNSESQENLIENQDDETMYLNLKNKAILLDGRLPGEPRFYNFKLFCNQNENNDETTNESNVNNKLNQRKYALQIYNNKKLIYESNECELDQNLQIKYVDLRFEESTFENSMNCNLIEIKGNRKKLLTKFELSLEQILMQTLLHNNKNFNVKSDFAIKSTLSGELVVHLNEESTDQSDNSVEENSLSRSSDKTEQNRFTIKYDFNGKKLGKFEFKEMKDRKEKSDEIIDKSIKDRLLFVIKMKNEIYNQKELNELLKVIKNNYSDYSIANRMIDQETISTNERDLQTVSNSLVNLFKIKPIELNQRLVLLTQRNNEEFDKRRIPLYDSHYLSFLIKDKQQIRMKSNYIPIELNQTNLNIDLLKDYENKKKAVIEYLIEVRKKFMNQSNTWNKNSKNYEDYVYEEIDTSLSTLNFDFLFLSKESKRPLRPNRKERKKYTGQSLIQQLNTKTSAQTKSTNQMEKVKIMINIMSGLNIPVRRQSNQVKDAIPNEISTSHQQLNQPNQLTQNYANFTKRLNELFHDELHSYNSLDSVISRNIAIDLSLKEQKVCPFIEVSFQDQIIQTSVAESNQPAWNETIKLDLNVPNDDYSPSNLLKIDNFIYFNLFDQIEITDDELEIEKKFSATSPSKKYTKNWLGSIAIPFITLYLNSNGKMDGTFCLNKPTYLTDYDFETKPTFSLLTTGHNQELDSSYLNNLDSKKNSYLNLFLTIDPQLCLPNKIEFKCSSDEEIYNYAKDWQSQLNKKYPDRLIKSLVINLANGKHTLITRFLSPLEPPAEFLKTDQYNETIKDYKSILMKNLARYVSLIPLITNELASIGLIDELIWADCEQFLKMNFGSIEEHAILLCNYFLYLGLNSGLCLGTSVQEGKTCWVIVWLNEPTNKEDNFLNVQLWHPISGQHYYVHTDSFLPLTSADCIVKKDNVYANIQKEDQPNRISFNISKMNCWRPLFNLNKLRVNLNSIQPNKFEYEPANENYVINLEQQIEVYLKESLMKCRRQKKTFFNRFCTREIKKELAQMEYKVCYLKDTLDPNEEINKILSTYQINGIQLNMPFNGIDQLAKLIYSTGLHLNTNDKTDFVIAVHLHAYPHNVYSVWIYCAHIHTK